MDAVPEPLHITYATCQETDEVVTLTLAEHADETGRTLSLSFWYDFDAHEVISDGNKVAPEAVQSWKLAGRDLHLEYDQRSATKLGVPPIQHLHLDVEHQQLADIRDHLIEILSNECHVVE